MFGLEDPILISILIICVLFVCAFEFINGFHDTANAVATVIYTNTLKPRTAVMWAGFCNFIGVLVGGIAVAMGIVNLLPVEALVDVNTWHSVGMVLSILLTAIIWNLGTWYFGIPCSSSHTLIGSILGVGLAFSLLPEASGVGVNFSKAKEIGLSLLISPILGFVAALLMMRLGKYLIKNPAVFQPPHIEQEPPKWIRAVLILTCTGVSLSHGSNDGQKGVGLMMLVLIGIVPAHFALNRSIDLAEANKSVAVIERSFTKIAQSNPTGTPLQFAATHATAKSFDTALNDVRDLKLRIQESNENNAFQVRKDILLITRKIETLKNEPLPVLSPQEHKDLMQAGKDLRVFTDYAPQWVIILISLCLGIGTMIGWKRIVVTIGEKIGKTHLSFAQGAASELVAASTIMLSSTLGVPVSTTHVLSSGIAGSMSAEKGMSNLQPKTIRSIAIAWLLTLPVCIALSGGLFLLFRALL